MSKTAHYVTLYKYWINGVIKCTSKPSSPSKRTTGMRNLLRYSLLRRCFHDMKGRRPRSFNLSTGVFESIRRSTHIRLRLVCCSRSSSFSCCEDNAVRKLLMLTAVQSDVTHSASASTLERQPTLERERLLKAHAFNTER